LHHAKDGFPLWVNKPHDQMKYGETYSFSDQKYTMHDVIKCYTT